MEYTTTFKRGKTICLLQLKTLRKIEKDISVKLLDINMRSEIIYLKKEEDSNIVKEYAITICGVKEFLQFHSSNKMKKVFNILPPTSLEEFTKEYPIALHKPHY